MAEKTVSKIAWPQAGLAGCVFCSILRDTRGAELQTTERFNFFPASPLCCVTWVIEGEMRLISRPEEMERPGTAARLPDFMFSGAQLGPLVSWSPGDVFVVTTAFYPDAFSAMTGVDLSKHVGCFGPAEAALPGPFLRLCAEFGAAAKQNGVEAAAQAFERRLKELWSQVRPDGAAPLWRLQDWTRNLAARAALSAPGRSARQIARRIKALSGVNERELNKLAHTEQLYANIHDALEEEGEVNWARLAAVSGFSDQAHMIRRMRQHTGFTPGQLQKLSPSDEALWGYRLLGQYFSRPE